MDPVSQAALGAAWAEPRAHRGNVLAAAVVGAVAGMAPDADILIRSSTDPLLALEYHRHFTHALAFVPVGALLSALVVFPFVRRQLSFASCYGFSVLGFASHGLLDACTSYGTLLLWPFSDRRIAWDIISVVDPLFTLPLIGFVVAGVLKRAPKLALVGLAWCLLYLSLGAVQHQRAEAAALGLAASRGHVATNLTVKPSLANLLLWKSIYGNGGLYYVDAVRVGFSPRVYPGETRVQVNPARDFPWLEPGTQQWRDVERFRWFAAGYLALDRDNPERIVDMRYSLVPNRGDGLWGIELDPEAGADQHAAYVTMRLRSGAEGRELLRMILLTGLPSTIPGEEGE